ncbi:MAG: non-canonical purine NTP diphosphatase [Bacteroidia bacterium]
MEFVFASGNKDKIKEARLLISSQVKILSLTDIFCTGDIPETSDTIEGNALQKANYVFEKYGYNCFSDDTGLEIEALNGKPGTFSARYAGNEKNTEANIQKVLFDLNEINNRKARFKTAIALIMGDEKIIFEGIVTGTILSEKRGNNGFGYDPIFVPDGYDKTFSEMSLLEKNKLSHRAKAFQKLMNYLNEHAHFASK